MKFFLIIFLLTLAHLQPLFSSVWKIGPDRQYKFCSEVSSHVADGDTVEIDKAIYENDWQVIWRADNLYIKGIGGMPVLKAGERIAIDNSNGKGIFVIKGNNTTVENIEFREAKVISNNGAGIRQEGANLIVRYCVFNSNQMGILQGGSIENCTIIIEFCDFFNNGNPDNPGYQHNIYINHIENFIFMFNYTHDASGEGHELKSRADNNFILYNRIANINSIDSRNIDLPNGGTAVIVGNIIEQGENSANSNIIGFGMEGLINSEPHNLWMCNNTIVNKKSKGSFVQVSNIDTLMMWNNIFTGRKTGGFLVGSPSVLDSSHNLINDDISAAKFYDAGNFDYHIKFDSPARNAGAKVTQYIKGTPLSPIYEYDTGQEMKSREIIGQIDIGAYENDVINSFTKDNNSKIYIVSDPVKDLVTVKALKPSIKYYICLYDIMGKLLLNYSIHPTTSIHRINVSEFPAGIYYISIKTKHRSTMKTILVSK